MQEYSGTVDRYNTKDVKVSNNLLYTRLSISMTLLDDMLHTRYILKQTTVTGSLQVSDIVAVSIDKDHSMSKSTPKIPDPQGLDETWFLHITSLETFTQSVITTYAVSLQSWSQLNPWYTFSTLTSRLVYFGLWSLQKRCFDSDHFSI